MHRRLHAPSPMHEHSTNSRGSARTRSWRIVNASASRIPMSVRPLARGSFRGVSKDVFHQPKDTSWSIRLIELNDGVPRVRRTDRLLACPTARRSRQQPKAWCESGKWAPVQRSRPCACFSHCSPIFTWLWEVAVFGSAISRKFYVNPLSLYLQWQCYSLIKANSLHLTDKLAQPGEETRPQKKKSCSALEILRLVQVAAGVSARQNKGPRKLSKRLFITSCLGEIAKVRYMKWSNDLWTIGDIEVDCTKGQEPIFLLSMRVKSLWFIPIKQTHRCE